MESAPPATLLAAIERSRARLWGVCYRMTGSRSDADDLCQEAIARAIEGGRTARSDEAAGLEPWLVRVAVNACLDHRRRESVRRRITDLVDPIESRPFAVAASPEREPEAAAILRDDIRFAVIVALQRLSPRQRAALLLHDVCDHPIEDVAAALGTNANAAKALLHRARAALIAARGRTDVDLTVDPRVVDRLVLAIESRSVPAFVALLDDEVWGVIDGGGIVHSPSKPIHGRRAVGRLWANAGRRQVVPIGARVRVLNGEPTVVVVVPSAGDAPIASLHLETRRERIAALRVVRDPRKLWPDIGSTDEGRPRWLS